MYHILYSYISMTFYPHRVLYVTEKGISFPEFLGNSYLQHPNLDFSERKSNDLYLSFKTRSQDGSLLYSHGPGNDFIHLFIADGYLRYQASCGPTNVLFVDTRVRVNRDTLVSVSVRWVCSIRFLQI